MRRDSKAGRAVATGLSLALAGTLFLAPATPAFAVDTELEQLQEAAIEAADAYQVAQDKVDQIAADVAANQAKVAELEDQLPDKQSKAAAAIKTQYKLGQEQANLVSLLLSSESFGDFISRLYYLDAVAESSLGSISDLSEATSELKATQAQLDSDLEEAERQQQTAQYAYEQAQKAAEAARKKAMEHAEEARRQYEAQQAAGEQDPTVTEIAEATAQANQDTDGQATAEQEASAKTSETTAEAQQEDQSQTSSDDAEATTSEDSASASNDAPETTASTTSDATGQSASAPESASSSAGATSASTAAYTYVQASWYGEGDGFMYGMTASGDYVTPTSMGVAMKTMPLGTIIEITYNGKTVTAVVNDRGPYVGNRQIDLQPAVAHALGFTGVGTVGYRVVG